MKFKVYHIEFEPINIRHRLELYNERRKLYDPMLQSDYSSKTDEEKLAITQNIEKEERKFVKKYPATAVWTINNLAELMELNKIYGTLSVCIEKKGRRSYPTIYVYPTEEELAQRQKDKEELDTLFGRNKPQTGTANASSESKQSE